MMPLSSAALARPRHGDDRVVAGDHAEIAVIGFGRMDEEGRRAGRGQRRGDLRADMAALADAGHDDAAGDAEISSTAWANGSARPFSSASASAAMPACSVVTVRNADAIDGRSCPVFFSGSGMHGAAISALATRCPTTVRRHIARPHKAAIATLR